MKIPRTARTLMHRLMFFFVAVLFASSLEAKTHLKIAVGDSRIEGGFNRWNAATPWEKIDHYESPDAIRPVIDLILELQALKAGGLDFDFELVLYPGYERSRLEAAQGHADLSAETIWDRELALYGNDILKTDPIIRVGEFEKGLYVLETNQAALKVQDIDGLKNFIGAIPAPWGLDVELLEQLHPKSTEKPGRIENVFFMLEKGRADFTLQEFSAKPDLSIENDGVRFVPIPNCKVAINDSRSWLVSKAAPNATEIFAALEKGVKVLRADGRIEKAFKESGFWNATAATWKRLK
jgi:hypothetical protein